MPTYEYLCNACKHEFEEFHSITAAPIKKCPQCKKFQVVRKISMGAGILFKGGGFYETDYRSDNYKKAAESDKPKADTKTDTKPQANPDVQSKTQAKSEATSGESKPSKPAESKPKSPRKN